MKTLTNKYSTSTILTMVLVLLAVFLAAALSVVSLRGITTAPTAPHTTEASIGQAVEVDGLTVTVSGLRAADNFTGVCARAAFDNNTGASLDRDALSDWRLLTDAGSVLDTAAVRGVADDTAGGSVPSGERTESRVCFDGVDPSDATYRLGLFTSADPSTPTMIFTGVLG